MNEIVNDSDANEQKAGRANAKDKLALSATTAPTLALPKSGGAIHGIGEKFGANPVTGTGVLSVPIATSAGRSGYGPSLSLSYNSSTGNSPFGFGCSLNLPSITRKTDKGLPQYFDADDSDVFMLAGSEDLVPVMNQDKSGKWTPHVEPNRTVNGIAYALRLYRPRIEGQFARIERWTNLTDSSDVFWRSISRDNGTVWYGRSAESRIADVANQRKIFSWLISESHDDKGNVIVYRYKAEDSVNINNDASGNPVSRVCEHNRSAAGRTTQRYIKSIRYGNAAPYYPHLKPDAAWPVAPDAGAADASNAWLFEVVFDYGEHDANNPLPTDAGNWFVRPDPYSDYRPGFEVRSYRKCRRVLMFHHFPNEAAVSRNCLVRSTDFTYSDTVNPSNSINPIYSFLIRIGQIGYQRKVDGNGYTSLSTPPIELTYSMPTVQAQIVDVDRGALDNLPVGLYGRDPRNDNVANTYRWVDLHGEGVPGILNEQGDAWHYKRNISPIPQVQADGSELVTAQFGPSELVALRPNVALSAGAEIVDLGGDGQPEVVVMSGATQGYFAHDDNEGWLPFVAFLSRTTRNLGDPNTRLVDLDGDGLADVLITEDSALVWHQSLGRAGFSPSMRVDKAKDEESGARVVFADGTETILLADMSGDGLVDIVRVRNSDICYWPNLGFGRFGAKVAMDNAPTFDLPERFNPARLRLADIDGSGTTDLIYLHDGGIQLVFNQSGNGWSQVQVLPVFPRVDDLTGITVCDLLGNGTACLVWSSPLPADTGMPMRYLNLMGGVKPHLLIRSINNYGAETQVTYAPSTKFYLQDKRDGKPWITKLPFPVHVVEKVETFDHISETRFVTRYAYHHGYYDRPEREFRGFGMVEQWDTEAYEDYVKGVVHVDGGQTLAPELYQPPVTTRNWYHTGAYLSAGDLFRQYQSEFFQQGPILPQSIFPSGLDAISAVECTRALKGLLLRQEVYSYDGTGSQNVPYAITETCYEMRQMQPHQGKVNGVFFPVGRESISLHLERNAADPRVSHALILDADQFGNPVHTCSVVYGRRTTDPSLPAEVTADQQRIWITYTESDFTGDQDQTGPLDVHRLRTVYETRNYEITGISPAATYFALDEIKGMIGSATPIDYETIADGTSNQKRLMSQSRLWFLDNSLNPLPLGAWDTLALTYQSHTLAFTPNVIANQYAGGIADADLSAAGYIHSAGDNNWWIPSGTAVYPANPASSFYMPSGSKDALGLETRVTYDAYFLLVQQVASVAATWNVNVAVNDYRVLGPVLLTNPNGNRVAVMQDELGMVIRTAVMGKSSSTDGDTLADPTTRIEYDLFNWMNNGKPCYVHTFAREQHGAANPRWQESFAYSNGSGAVAMVKAQAHPGNAYAVQPDGTLVQVNANPRWVGNGRTIVNNKGNAVKRYEPYFSTTSDYEDEKSLRQIGVTPILYYDPVGRNIRTDYPNGTFTTVNFTAWMQAHYDANDTVLQSQWYAERGSPDPSSTPEPKNNPERRAAVLAAKHANTPAVQHGDSLGRTVYAVSDYGGGVTAGVRSAMDLGNRNATVFDQITRKVAEGFNGMAGAAVYGVSAEKGKRWTFQNVLGAMVKTWDEFGRQFRIEYDDLHRPLATYVKPAGQSELLFNYVVYGDRLKPADALAANLLGTSYLIYDQAGLVQVPALDFKGNPWQINRMLASDYKNDRNWSSLATQVDVPSIISAGNALLDTSETFAASSTYDALNRPMRLTFPDSTVVVPTYDESSRLASVQAQIRGAGAMTTYLVEQDYDAKGQRQYAKYGNNLITNYLYDASTFRLVRLVTAPTGATPANKTLQNLQYTYDPVGNITQINDSAQQTNYFNNAVVAPQNLYAYDALYQLVSATGRELAGGINDKVLTSSDLAAVALPLANDTTAVRNYTETYQYDLLGNIQLLKHTFAAQPGIGSGWTRYYKYLHDSNPADNTNRLDLCTWPTDADPSVPSGKFSYDDYGNMTAMPGLPTMDWDFVDRLKHVDLGGGGQVYCTYGSGGQRARKVIERIGNLKLEWIYLGALTIFRRRKLDTDAKYFERQTIEINDSTGRIAQVDTKLMDDQNDDPANPLNVSLTRYQYTNHLGSAVLETNQNGAPISYEEYHPFGTTSYVSGKSGVDISLKRYRFSGKERDAETGLYYFGARYMAPWLGRWVSADTVGFTNSTNLFRYCSNNPVMMHDPSGNDDKPLNKAGEVSWEIPKSVFKNAKGKKLKDDQAISNFKTWMKNAHPDIKYKEDSVTIRWVRREKDGKSTQVAVFNADWQQADGKLLLPKAGEPGYVTSWSTQEKAEYSTPGDPKTRTTENEHVATRAGEKMTGGDPDRADSGSTPTVRSTRQVSLDKTKADNLQTKALENKVNAGGAVNHTEDVTMAGNEHFHQANDANGRPIRPGSINRGTLAGTGYKFEEERLDEVAGKLPAPPSTLSALPGGGGGAGSWMQRAGNFGKSTTTTLARGLVPSFAEMEDMVPFIGPMIAAATTAVGVSAPASVYAVVDAIAAAPTSFAAAVTAPAIGGAIVGNLVEEKYGVGAAVLSAAATGAIIGTFIPIPGVSTLAGAAIGAGIGLIGYGISKLF